VTDEILMRLVIFLSSENRYKPKKTFEKYTETLKRKLSSPAQCTLSELGKTYCLTTAFGLFSS